MSEEQRQDWVISTKEDPAVELSVVEVEEWDIMPVVGGSLIKFDVLVPKQNPDVEVRLREMLDRWRRYQLPFEFKSMERDFEELRTLLDKKNGET